MDLICFSSNVCALIEATARLNLFQCTPVRNCYNAQLSVDKHFTYMLTAANNAIVRKVLSLHKQAVTVPTNGWMVEPYQRVSEWAGE